MSKRFKFPTVAQIAQIKKPFTAMSFFAGCGGSSLGMKAAGYNVLFANEFIGIAADTYSANAPDTVVSKSDIRKLNPEKILKHFGLKPGELDHLDGSPPCSAFSTAGTQNKGWGQEKLYSENVKQRVDDLFYEFCRMLAYMQPKTFDAENVAGLTKGVAKGYAIEIMRALSACGYKVRAQVLNASYLDVPQARERIIFVGVRNDLPFDPVFPVPRNYQVLVNEVLPNIALVKSKKRGDIAYVPASIPSPTITASDGTNSETAGFSCGGFVEDVDGKRRKYTIKELKVICGFPSDFKLLGKFEQQWERLGRSHVPPQMYHIMTALRKQIHEPLRELEAKGKFKPKTIKPVKPPKPKF